MGGLTTDGDTDREADENTDGDTKTVLPGLLRCLSAALDAPLPGRSAQGEMAPMPRASWDPDYRPPAPPRQGGVLALFYPHANVYSQAKGDQSGSNGGTGWADLSIPLILRPTYEGVHSGQVSFPGGGKEPEDPDILTTALREAYEEVGVRNNDVVILGQLTPLYIRPSNFEVVPTVGWIPRRPDFRIDPYEVAQLLETPLTTLLNPENRHEELWKLRDHAVQVPFFSVKGQTVWGATAMILSELLTLIRGCLPPSE